MPLFDSIKNSVKSVRELVTGKSYLGFTRSILSGTNLNWSKSDFLKAYEISLYTNKAIEKRAEKVGQVKFVLKKSDKEVEDPRLNVLYKPNKFFSGTAFWNLYQKYLDLTGCAYILMISQPELFAAEKVTELYLLRPDLVQKKKDSEGNIIEFEYHTAIGVQKYKPEEILYSFRPDPSDPLEGMSLLKAGIRAIETETQISDYHNRILKNGGKVEGVFKFKTPKLTRTQLDELKDDYKELYAGAKKSGMPLFLGGDADYTRMGLSPDELSYLEAKKMTMNDILILTGVPKSMLASTDEVKYDNAEADRRIFLRETIKPLLEDLVAKLDVALFKEDNLELTFVDPTPEDMENKRKNIELANSINALTTNQKIGLVNDLLGTKFEPVKEGDDVLVPFNMTPLNSGNGDNKPAETKNFDTTKFNHPLRDKFVRHVYYKVALKKQERHETKFKLALAHYFRGQSNRVIEKINSVKTFKKKTLLDEAFDESLELKIAKEEFIPLLTQILEQSGYEAAELGGLFNFTLVPEINRFIADRVEFFSDSINQTTFEQLKKQFEESLEAGETRAELVNRIKNTYKDIQKGRAETIVRTEVHTAINKGRYEGYKQSGMPIKIWVHTFANDPREQHLSIDGQERPINVPFRLPDGTETMYPGESGDPSHDINCHCVI